MVHLVDDNELSMENFDIRLKLINNKRKEEYEFVISAGEAYIECLYNLLSKKILNNGETLTLYSYSH